MLDNSDIILRLVPENALSNDICCMEENCRQLYRIAGSSVLALRYSCPPKDPMTGFVFGHDKESCDVIFNSSTVDSRHFSITFNPTAGLPPLLVNRGRSETDVHETTISPVNQSVILENRTVISFGSYRFRSFIPIRRYKKERYVRNHDSYLRYMLSGPLAGTKYTTPSRIMERVGPYYEFSRFRKVLLLLCAQDTGDMFTAKRLCEGTAVLDVKQEARMLCKLSHVCHKTLLTML